MKDALKVAYILARLSDGKVSSDAAELLASRVDEIKAEMLTAMMQRAKGGRLERQHVRGVLNDFQRKRLNGRGIVIVSN